MDRPRVPVSVYLLLVFAGGLAAGFFADRVYTLRTVSAHAVPRNAEEWKRKYLADLRSRCHLSDAQLAQASVVLDATRKQAEALRARTEPEWAALHQDQGRQMRALLQGAQLLDFDKFQAERDAQRRARQNKR